MKHVYNGAVAETFLGDALFGADRTIPVEERVDSAVKRVQKLTTAAKAAVGQTSRGGSSSGRRGGGRRGGFSGGRQQHYNRDFRSDYRPSGPPSFGRFGPGSFGGSNFGGGRGNGERTCFICGSTGHQAKQCPKAG